MPMQTRRTESHVHALDEKDTVRMIDGVERMAGVCRCP